MNGYIPQIENGKIPMKLARKFVKEGKVMAVRFGSKGFKSLFEEFKETNGNPTVIFLDKLIPVLKDQGYSEMQIARWVLEEAVDVLVALQIKFAGMTIKKYGKVPKWIFLPGTLGKYVD